MSSVPPASPADPEIPLIARPATQFSVWFVVTLSACLAVSRSWLDPAQRQAAISGLLLEPTKDAAPLLPLLLAAPLVWWSGRARLSRLPVSSTVEYRPLVDVLLMVALAVLGFLASRWYALPFDGLPPAIHDEYSYLFQARTFLEGRTWLPGFPQHPELFDQMHVLNEGRFASRYFPATGAWLAPFVALGNPWEGQWIANGLIAAGVYLAGRLLSGRAVALIASLLYIVSPGMLVFSNMLVAHMPTLLGLIVFLNAMLVARQRPGFLWPLVAGAGLAFGMLCRPMTAAGFALPFGVDWLWRLFRSRSPAGADTYRQPGIRETIALGLPLVLGAALLLGYNQSITGHPLRSPYQLYTDLYTPRHVYGFNNVVRGEQKLGPKVLDNYDRWARNLTPALAIENVGIRATASARWVLGLIPLMLAAAVILLDWRHLPAGWRLVVASVVSLHLAHIPYWFTGMLDWHYVFETGPLLILLFARATARLMEVWQSWSAPRMSVWWTLLVGTTVCVNDVSLPPLWRSRLDVARSEAMFARARFGLFQAEAAERAAAGPIVVFVRPDPDDLHMDYVTNPPTLTGPVLTARELSSFPPDQARSLFQDRKAYLYDVRKRSWEELP